MNGAYRHTQIGWLTLTVAGLMALLLGPALYAAEITLGLWGLGAVLVLLVAVFGSLTVAVDDEQVLVRFGSGLLKKRIPLADVRRFEAVRNPWYYGWGWRLYPGGVLYNVSGLDAVELVLHGGKRLRIGTNEPKELALALETRLGKPEALSEEEMLVHRRTTRISLAIFGGVMVFIVAGLAILFHYQMQPPSVRVTDGVFRVKGAVYSAEVPLKDVVAVTLEPGLPRIISRSNGFSLAGTLRGNFQVARLGHGKLFVEANHPPYMLVRMRRSFVFVNFESPEQTRVVFAGLEKNWHEVNAPSP